MKFTLPTIGSAAVQSDTLAAATKTDIPSSVAHAGSEKQHVATNASNESDSESELEKIDPAASHGTQQAQAMKEMWSVPVLIVAFIFIWILNFVLAYGNGIVGTLTPYVISDYQKHSLTALTGVISQLCAGLFKLPYAKIMDIWGRPQALTLGVVLITFGCVLMASVSSVEQYCAAQVFYWMGYNCINLSNVVFIADFTPLRFRGFFLAFSASPFLITTWIYGYAANNFIYGNIGLRWGFGIFCIVFPVVASPWLAMLYYFQHKAEKSGLVPRRPSYGTVGQTVYHYLVEFDVVGLLILALGLSLFLLSFNIYSYQTEQWRSPLIICFIIFGALLVGAFAAWEKYYAPITFIPWHLLTNRTVIFTYVMAFSLYCSFYIWNSYFYSMLVVLFNQPVLYATYILNTYTMGSCLISLVYGLALIFYGKLKVYSLGLGIPLTLLGVGLMIKYHQPNVDIGYVVLCQVLFAFGGGILVISEQTTLMAVSALRNFPALLAVEAAAIAIGGAVGSTIAGAMWTGILPGKLAQNLPAESIGNLTEIYGSIYVQTAYLVGSPTRDAIDVSYGQTLRLMLIVALCILVIAAIAVALWENVDVKKNRKEQGDATAPPVDRV